MLGATLILGCGTRESSSDADSLASADSVTSPALAAVDSGAPEFPPRDEANEAFSAWRELALSALARKDTVFLRGMLSPVIKTGFGPEGGIDDFKSMWKTNDPSSSVWATLTRVLRMGGQQTSDSTFTAPYVFAFWPDSLDAFEHIAVTSSGAAIRTQPDERSEAFGTASHTILRFKEWVGVRENPAAPDTSWARVELLDTRTGWLKSADVFSPVGWRAAFVRRGEQWIMLMFVAGD
jgi:hypothetical protein